MARLALNPKGVAVKHITRALAVLFAASLTVLLGPAPSAAAEPLEASDGATWGQPFRPVAGIQ